MAETKKFLDFTGLSLYDSKIKAYIADQIGGAGKLTYSVVTELPAVAEADPYTIYMVARGKSGQETSDIYDEYLLINGAFELIGNTDVDFSNYYTKSEIDAKETALKGNAQSLSSEASIAGAKKYADEAVAAKNVGATGDALVSASASNNTVTVGATSSLTTAVANANNALQGISKSGNYINVTEKSSNSQTISLTTQDVETATTQANGLAVAKDVKDYVDASVSGKNVSASGETGADALVTASAANNEVTVATTQKLKDAVTRAESAVLSVTKGSTGTENKVSISVVDGDNVTITLDDSALKTWIDKIDGDNTTSGSIAKALKDAKDYADGKITGLTETTKTSSEGDFVTVTVKTEFGQVKSVSIEETVVNLADATATNKGLAEAKDVKDYVDTAVAGKNVSASGETGTGALVTASASNNEVTVATTQKLKDAVAAAESAVQSVTEGSANGTISVDGTNVAVHGLDTAAYTTVTALNSTAQGYANAVLGTNADTSASVTVYGARAYADSLVADLNPVDRITDAEINGLFS